MPRCLTPRHPALFVAVLLAALTVWGLLPMASRSADDAGTLRQKVQKDKQQEQALGSAAERLGRLERSASRGVAVLQGRLADVQAEAASWESKLARTQTDLRASRAHLASLRRRLAHDRGVLASVLRGAYQADEPDLITVVLGAHDFADLLDRAEFFRRVDRRNGQILDNVRSVRATTLSEERTLARLLPRQVAATAAVQRDRDALAQVTQALEARRAALEQARAARLAALRNTRAGRRSAEHALAKLEAAQQRAAVDKAGPGGPWAIPWAIVQCESGGQNLPPNSAGASGYYQFMPATWRALGGSTPNAYQAPKAEQDRLAAQLWAGGSGARNWDCAAIVGII